MSDDEIDDPDQRALKDIDVIFSQWKELKDKLRHAASLLRHVSVCIEAFPKAISLSDQVVARFEAVCLWLRKVLPDLSPEVREQALKLLEEAHAEHSIAALHTLGDEYRRRLRFRQSGSIIAAMVNAIGIFKLGIDDSTAAILREEQLQSTKVALTRLSGMLEYAANDLDEVEDFDDVFYRNHYNPKKWIASMFSRCCNRCRNRWKLFQTTM